MSKLINDVLNDRIQASLEISAAFSLLECQDTVEVIDQVFIPEDVRVFEGRALDDGERHDCTILWVVAHGKTGYSDWVANYRC